MPIVFNNIYRKFTSIYRIFCNQWFKSRLSYIRTRINSPNMSGKHSMNEVILFIGLSVFLLCFFVSFLCVATMQLLSKINVCFFLLHVLMSDCCVASFFSWLQFLNCLTHLLFYLVTWWSRIKIRMNKWKQKIWVSPLFKSSSLNHTIRNIANIC